MVGKERRRALAPQLWLWVTQLCKSRTYISMHCSKTSQVGYRTALLGTKMYLVELLKRYRVVLKKHDYKVSPGEILGVEKPLAVELYERQPRRKHP